MREKIEVTRTSMPLFEEYIDEIAPLWESRWITHMGVKHQELERRLEEYLNVDHVSLFTNGHLALQAVIAAFDLKGEVITTPYTFASTTQAIVQNGLTPVFCDVNPSDFTIDVTKIENLITDNTCAIVPVHVYGNPCDVYEIERIAKRNNLKVIYDGAHAFGMTINNRGIGAYGDATMFSFHATKVFNTIEGGGVTFSEDNLIPLLMQQKYYGMGERDCYPTVAGNGKMTEFQAAMGLCNLRHIDEEIKKRKKIVEIYQSRLGGRKGLHISPLKYDNMNVTFNYAYFPVVFEEEIFGKSRDQVLDALKKNNIMARKYFYPLTSEFACYKGRFKILDTPIAKKISESVLTIPLYAGLDTNDANFICDVILN